MYILSIFLFLISIQSGHSQYYTRIDEQCIVVEDVAGTCKPFFSCPFAIKIVEIEHQQPPTNCFYDETKKVLVVCCPNNASSILGGPKMMSRNFSPTRILKTEKMTCTYEDQEPFLCCKNRPKKPVDLEPPGCPKLPKPELNTPLRHPAWEKCVSYQRYFNVCVATDESNKHFFRNDVSSYLDKRSVMRIMGGIPADIMEYPHMAVIGIRDSEETDIQWIGGGSLISDQFVLTAAHVAFSKRGMARYALFGVVNKLNIREGLLCNIIKRHVHPLYSQKEGNKDHDIALVELFERVQFNQFIRPACLPVPKRKIEETYTVAGWGKTEKSSSSSVLLYVHVRNEPTKCKDVYKDGFKSDIMLCMRGAPVETADSCTGDSGGPLMAKFTNLNRSYSIEGVVSFGAGCGSGAGVYTKVSTHMDFIMNIVWKKEWSIYKDNLKRQS